MAVGVFIVAALVHHVDLVLASTVRLDREGKGLEDRELVPNVAVVVAVIHALAPAG